MTPETPPTAASSGLPEYPELHIKQHPYMGNENGSEEFVERPDYDALRAHAASLSRELAAKEGEIASYSRSLATLAEYPAECPFTKLPFFMTIEHPEEGAVATYGGPFDSYTIPTMELEVGKPWHEGELTRHHFDHDHGAWMDDESMSVRVVSEDHLYASEQQLAEANDATHAAITQLAEQAARVKELEKELRDGR